MGSCSPFRSFLQNPNRGNYTKKSAKYQDVIPIINYLCKVNLRVKAGELKQKIKDAGNSLWINVHFREFILDSKLALQYAINHVEEAIPQILCGAYLPARIR